jgi:hypothetical protein
MKGILTMKRAIFIIAALALSVTAVTPAVNASTFDASSCTINANAGGPAGTYGGYGLDGDNGAALIGSNCTSYTLSGSMDAIRGLIIGIYTYISGDASNTGSGGTTPAPGTPQADLAAKLASAKEVKLAPTDVTAALTTADLNYINFITGFLGVDTTNFIVDLTANNIDLTQADLSVINYKVRTVTADGRIVVVDKNQLDQLLEMADTVTTTEGVYDEKGTLLMPGTGIAAEATSANLALPITAISAGLLGVAGFAVLKRFNV